MKKEKKTNEINIPSLGQMYQKFIQNIPWLTKMVKNFSTCIGFVGIKISQALKCLILF